MFSTKKTVFWKTIVERKCSLFEEPKAVPFGGHTECKKGQRDRSSGGYAGSNAAELYSQGKDRIFTGAMQNPNFILEVSFREPCSKFIKEGQNKESS